MLAIVNPALHTAVTPMAQRTAVVKPLLNRCNLDPIILNKLELSLKSLRCNYNQKIIQAAHFLCNLFGILEKHCGHVSVWFSCAAQH